MTTNLSSSPATEKAGSASCNAGLYPKPILKHVWDAVGCAIVDEDRKVLMRFNGGPLNWRYSPADLELRQVQKAVTALPALLEAVETALFAVTADADANDGKVDRVAVAETMRKALDRAGVAS